MWATAGATTLGVYFYKTRGLPRCGREGGRATKGKKQETPEWGTDEKYLNPASANKAEIRRGGANREKPVCLRKGLSFFDAATAVQAHGPCREGWWWGEPV